jgi:hypothetical protein
LDLISKDYTERFVKNGCNDVELYSHIEDLDTMFSGETMPLKQHLAIFEKVQNANAKINPSLLKKFYIIATIFHKAFCIVL